MNITFREMTFEDIDETIELCNLCFEEKTDLKYAKDMFEATKSDPNQIYIIGVMDDKIIAHLKITVIPTIYEKMNTYAILNHVCVHPDYRRHKFATEMLDYAFDICKRENCKAVELWSMNFRVAAHSLYKEYGFHVDDAKFFSKQID